MGFTINQLWITRLPGITSNEKMSKQENDGDMGGTIIQKLTKMGVFHYICFWWINQSVYVNLLWSV